ncbi:MAG: hypothetical protein M1426_00765 [Patescibacteria group bacterium]|nr:hypothetical protein [Patescibacteria group bacterium]
MPGVRVGRVEVEPIVIYNFPMVKTIELEHDFIPVSDPIRSPDVRAFQRLVLAYRKFPTEESGIRIAALRKVGLDLAASGIFADLFIGGSLHFFQSTPTSDVDVFCVTTTTKGVGSQEVVDRYRAGLSEELGTNIRFDSTQASFFYFPDLEFYLKEFFQADLDVRFPSAQLYERAKVVKGYYHQHQVSTKVGPCGNSLFEVIGRLRLLDEQVARTLVRNAYLDMYGCSFHSSLEKYKARVRKHEDILRMPEPFQKLHMSGLSRLQHEFFVALDQKEYLLQNS